MSYSVVMTFNNMQEKMSPNNVAVEYICLFIQRILSTYTNFLNPFDPDLNHGHKIGMWKSGATSTSMQFSRNLKNKET